MSRTTQTWIALLRGVNVGGKNKLPMKELAALLETLGLSDVRTYIQSGNAVFQGPRGPAPALAAAIASAIEDTFDFRPGVIVIGKEEFAKAAASNPFPEAAQEDGKTLHLFFLGEAPPKGGSKKKSAAKTLDAACLDAVTLPSERWRVAGAVFYLHAPEGFGNSKLAAKAERCLGVPATARNWRTVCELLKLADDSH
jgi:uncharacterized protein (DUF1697 family)